jgi:hypothetical protein
MMSISAITVPGNDTHLAVVHVPRSWNGKRWWVMTGEYYTKLKGGQMK